jgi:N-acetylglucosaminyl-diphospho-decaprenol L-rhamnosyltransferase
VQTPVRRCSRTDSNNSIGFHQRNSARPFARQSRERFFRPPSPRIIGVVNTSSARSPFSLPLTVVVVAADSGPALRDCVASVLASALSLELILVDNASRDAEPAAIARAYEQDRRLHVIYNHENLGFGPAVNLAVKQAHGEALLILNPDCLLGDNDLPRLLALLAARPKAGLIGVVVCDADGTPDPASWRRDPLLRRALNSMLRRGGETVNVSQAIPHEVLEVEAISGALMLMRRWKFERIGGFDEGYFLHCEDLDLCRRVRDNGYQVLLAGDIRVHHGKGGSSRHRPVFVSRYKHRGMWRWFRQHDPASSNIVVAGLVWLGIWTHFLLKIPAQLLRLALRR